MSLFYSVSCDQITNNHLLEKIQVLYMSSSFWLLGVESRDFSLAEKEMLAKLSKKGLLAKRNKFTKGPLFSLQCAFHVIFDT